ncbi:CLAVATA 3 [Spatholobus suberectus]|nr:CLAVATA 3 [Spatholobus suberectus]
MASKFIFTSVVLLMLLCLLLMREPSGCRSAYECFGADAAGLREIPNRKVLSVLKDKKTTLKSSLQGSSSIKYGEKPLSWELRKVPSGPDPLHHNGANPKRPQTP